jgi:hypothetical protein
LVASGFFSMPNSTSPCVTADMKTLEFFTALSSASTDAELLRMIAESALVSSM